MEAHKSGIACFLCRSLLLSTTVLYLMIHLLFVNRNDMQWLNIILKN